MYQVEFSCKAKLIFPFPMKSSSAAGPAEGVDATPMAVARIRQFAKASGLIEWSEQRALNKVVEVAKGVMDGSIRRFASEVDGRPCSRSTASDGTPLTVSHRVAQELQHGCIIRRSGNACHEFQVGISVYKCLDPAVTPRMALREPMPMVHGKTAAAEWSICEAFSQSLRQAGHLGPAVEHYCWDRAKYSALARLAKAWHVREEFVGKGGVTKDVLELTQIVICTPCACHDTQKAQEWGMFSGFRDRDMLRDIFVACASVRNGWNLVSTHVASWVASRLRYTEPLDQEHVSRLELFWSTMGVLPEVATTMTDILQLRFVKGELRVSQSVLEIADFNVVGSVVGALLGCWRIQKFTESRWHTVGTSSRGLAIGLVTGLSDLVDYILQEKKGSGYYLNGWYRLREDRISFVICCALVSRVSDAVMAELLVDARVLRTIETLKAVAAEEIDWLQNIPQFVYEALAELCPLSPAELRHNVLHAGQINYAFMHERFFAVTEEYPFRLAASNDDAQLAANLEALRVSAEPDEQATWQLWKLLQMGYSKKKLVGILQLIRDLEWSTLTAEQNHASAATLMKFHPEYSLQTLASRALICSVHRTMPAKTDNERLLVKLRRTLGQLVKRNPHKVNARSLHVRDLMAMARRTYGLGAGRPANLTKVIMRGAHKSFDSCSMAVQRKYSQATAGHCAGKRARHAEDINHTRAAIQLAEDRVEEEQAAGLGSVTWNDCAWGAAEMEQFEDLWELPEFAGRQLEERRAAAITAPEPISPHELEALTEHAVWEPEPAAAAQWVKDVAHHRASFWQCVFAIDAVDERAYFMFVFARQRPGVVFLSKLDFVEMDPLPPATPGVLEQRWSMRPVQFRFKWAPTHCISAAVLADTPIASIEVIQDVEHTESGFLETKNAMVLPLRDWLQLVPGPAVKDNEDKGSSSKRHKKGNNDELLAQFPWLEDYWRRGTELGNEKESRHSSSSGKKTDEPKVKTYIHDDDELEALWAEVHRYRSELASQFKMLETCDDFKTTCLGGEWTLEHKGVEADAIRGFASGQTAIKFCELQQMKHSKRFELSLYEMGPGGAFARAWCHKMQFFLNIALEAQDLACLFTEADIAKYVQPTEFAEAVRLLERKPLCMRAAKQIRALFI